MMKLPQLPQIGDMVIFMNDFVFIAEENGYGKYIEIHKNSIGIIADKTLKSPTDYGIPTDEYNLHLVLAVCIDDYTRYFKINYSLHKESIKIVDNTATAKVLFSNEPK